MDAIERRVRACKEAAQWWALLQAGDVPRAERERFVEWLGESKVHVTEILRIMQVHGTLDQFNEWDSIVSQATPAVGKVVPISPALTSAARPLDQHQAAGRRPKLKVAIAIAAAVAAVTVGVFTFVANGQGQLIATDRGERRELVLEDGSVVQVDPQTRLRVRFETHVRRLQLLEGRAVFRVAKNPQRPFVVESDDAKVRAVGTAFGVERRGDHVLVVTVAEGKVAVVTGAREKELFAAGSAATTPEATPRSEIYVTANQQATVQRAQLAVPVQTVDSSQELAWADGRLIFRNETMADVITAFNRYNRVQLRVTDATLSARRVSGVFDAAYPEEFIAFVQGALPVTIERADPGTITIAPRRSAPVAK
ncbi:FecR family protein [Steroidobacter sp.]|uniref:FecR family protein n=1 Tax=Steroidobacter sp. TaxID=1978227 RepID=UPI001A60440B|nr:FecR domain-containing protein [Steroidobacter sp.]MBL8270024.1 FecR domain-containing protein [Steroidobacter sp.]